MFFSGMTEVNTDIITPELAVGDDFEQAVELAKRAAASRDAQWAREEGINVEQHRILARGEMRHAYVLNPEGGYVVSDLGRSVKRLFSVTL